MQIGLINIDSKKPNLALEKIAKYHTDKGDEIIWNMPLVSTDKTYVSCIFSWNKHLCSQWEGLAEIGGSGYDIKKVLPEKIESLRPRINWGFTTRGCIRKCPFCIVPQKEGKIHAVGDLMDLWDNKSKSVILLDNNILAMPSHFRLVCRQARKYNLKLDFNQGLDIRLLTNSIAKELNSIRHVSDIRFAWDNISDEKAFFRGMKILQRNRCKRAMFYVIVGFDSTIEEDLYRFNKIKELGQRAYCMRHEKVKGDRLYNDLSSWVNQQRFFSKMDFSEFQIRRKNRNITGLAKEKYGLFE